MRSPTRNFQVSHHPDEMGYYPLEEMIYGKILTMRFLLSGAVSSGTGKFKTYREMPWGEVYLRQFGRTLHQAPSLLLWKPDRRFPSYFISYHGIPLEHGDAAYEVEIYPGYRIQMILWEGDEEFPPSSQILFSDNFPVSFQAEDMAVMGDVLIGSLKAWGKVVQSK